jgi:hypothetical protein
LDSVESVYIPVVDTVTNLRVEQKARNSEGRLVSEEGFCPSESVMPRLALTAAYDSPTLDVASKETLYSFFLGTEFHVFFHPFPF